MEQSTGHESRDTGESRWDAIDFSAIGQDAPIMKLPEEPRSHRHSGHRMSKEHIARIKRRHRRERFLITLDLTLLIIVCLGAAAAIIGLQLLQ